MNWQTCRNLLVSSLMVWGVPAMASNAAMVEVVVKADRCVFQGKEYVDYVKLAEFLKQQGVRKAKLKYDDQTNYALVGKVIYSFVRFGIELDMPKEKVQSA